jgi:hypothetical protein
MHHVAHGAADRGQLDRLDRHERARQPERDRAGGDLARVQLGAERGGGILRVHGERLDPVTVEDGGGETVTEQHESQARRGPLHRCQVMLTDGKSQT